MTSIGKAGSGTRLAGLLLAALFVACLAVAAGPAHADENFTVNSPGDVGDLDPGDGVCDASPFPQVEMCTLRAAIQEANATFGQATIRFAIPGDGVRTISPDSQLPALTGAVTVDGYTQPGAAPNTLSAGTNAKLLVQIDGTDAGVFSGLKLENSNNAVRGLVLNRFNGTAVLISGSGEGNRVEGNFVGTDHAGRVDLGNGAGVSKSVVSFAGKNLIGGSTPAARNLISGNGTGVRLGGGTGTRVEGNLVGTAADGVSPLGNSGDGVQIIDSRNNTVGGTAPGAANTIAFNGRDGIHVEKFGFDEATGNRLLRNSVFSNGGMGIDLRGPNEDTSTNIATPNDPGDGDTGPNDLQNRPRLAAATRTSDGATTFAGKLGSVPGRVFLIQFYSNPSGNEAGKLVGQKSVTTDARGIASFRFDAPRPVPAGHAITATATDTVGGNTSELSGPVVVAAR